MWSQQQNRNKHDDITKYHDVRQEERVAAPASTHWEQVDGRVVTEISSSADGEVYENTSTSQLYKDTQKHHRFTLVNATKAR